MATTKLVQRYTDRVFEVDNDSVDFWLERGFTRQSDPKPAKKAAAKKSSSSNKK